MSRYQILFILALIVLSALSGCISDPVNYLEMGRLEQKVVAGHKAGSVSVTVTSGEVQEGSGTTMVMAGAIPIVLPGHGSTGYGFNYDDQLTFITHLRDMLRQNQTFDTVKEQEQQESPSDYRIDVNFLSTRQASDIPVYTFDVRLQILQRLKDAQVYKPVFEREHVNFRRNTLGEEFFSGGHGFGGAKSRAANRLLEAIAKDIDEWLKDTSPVR